MSNLSTALGIIISVSTVLGIFTALINKLFCIKLEPIGNRIDNIEDVTLKNDMLIWRFQVTRFSSELRRGVPKTKFEFESIFTLITNYEMAVSKLNLENGFFESEVEYIKDQYKRLKEN